MKESRKSKRISQQFHKLARANGFDVKRTDRYIYCDYKNRIFFYFMGKYTMKNKAKAVEEVCNRRGYKFLAISFREFRDNRNKVLAKINSLKNITKPSSNLV
ncbi:MAG: hypothetical protein PHF67_05470 [Candidatus Nanoarchaeia archaeon]|nr:hypothetical protein [Candidatus Nanoarchaeia archaeon]